MINDVGRFEWYRPSNPSPDSPIAGDIIFVGDNRKGISRFGQTVARFQLSDFSHVALNLSGDICIHSMPEGGIRIDTPQDVVKQNESVRPYVVFRYHHFDTRDRYNLKDKIKHYCAPAFSRDYNWLFAAKSLRQALIILKTPRSVQGLDNVYCSEMVAQVYKAMDIKVSSKPVVRTLPIDIYRHVRANENDWEEVTNLYHAYFSADEYEADVTRLIQARQKRLEIQSLRILHNRQRREYGACEVSLRKLKFLPLKRLFFGDNPELGNEYKEARAAYLRLKKLVSSSSSLEMRALFSARRSGLLRQLAYARTTLLMARSEKPNSGAGDVFGAEAGQWQ